MSEWSFPGRLDRVIDGDTVVVVVDLGFNTRRKLELRLDGVDTAEIHNTSKDSEEYKRGIEQAAFVEEFCDAEGEWPLRVYTKERQGKYGRWLGDIVADGDFLTQALLAEWPEAEYE